MVKSCNPKVCVFDSGIGGLNLLYECVCRLPSVDFTYFADNFRMPYGNLEKSVLKSYVDEIFFEISKLKPSAAVIACNTVTASCIDDLRKKYEFPIIGIQPAVKPAAALGGKCLVLATPTTAESAAMKSLVEKYGEGRTEVVAIPELASLVEKNDGKISSEYLKNILPEVQADTVVLGCTHYIYAKDIIGQFYNCPVFDGIGGTAEHLRQVIGKTDHQAHRAQKIAFSGGDCVKNRRIFSEIILSKDGFPGEL